MVISIPLEKILTQLARGAVKITFGELRLAAPGVFVNSGGEHDHKPVMLPLNEILTRLNPALLSRRPPKSKSKSPKTSPDHSAPAHAAIPAVRFRPRRHQFVVCLPRHYAGNQRHPSAPRRSFTPHAPTPGNQLYYAAKQWRTETRCTHSFTCACKFANDPVEPGTISAPLAALSENWPEGLRLEIRQSNLEDAQVSLPANLIEPALKRGRITFTWRNLRPLIKPTPTSGVCPRWH
jgi:hypothetical protein